MPQRFFYGGECFRIVIVPTNITQLRKESLKCLLVIEAAGMLKTIFQARLQLRRTPPFESDTDDRSPERSSFCHSIKRREDHLVSQIASNTEEHQRI